MIDLSVSDIRLDMKKLSAYRSKDYVFERLEALVRRQDRQLH
jgi:hypothetical protein